MTFTTPVPALPLRDGDCDSLTAAELASCRDAVHADLGPYTVDYPVDLLLDDGYRVSASGWTSLPVVSCHG